jgi:hypothetical protein
MTPDERRILDEIRALVEENQTLLRSIQRHNRVSAVVKFLYWAAIIGLSFGAYYLVQPYVETLKSSLNDIGGGNIADISSFLK